MGCKSIKHSNEIRPINNKMITPGIKKEKNTMKNSNVQANTPRNKIQSKNYSVNFPASIGEIELPIYIKKGDTITIKIINLKSEWSFINDNKINYKGYNDLYYDIKNLGCIICRISSDKTKHYINNQEISFISQEEGSILLSCNLDFDNYSNYQLEGSIQLEIIGGETMKIDKLYQKLGYNIEIPSEVPNQVDPISENKLKLFTYINMVRINPNLFYKHYLYYSNENFLKDNVPIPELKISNILTEIAEKHNEYLCENGTIGLNETNNISLKERIDNNYCVFGESVFYGIKNPLLIVIKMLIDQFSIEKRNRINIMNANFQEIGISLKEHLIYQFSCVLVFGSKS